MRPNSAKTAGFTMAELLMVFAIIAIVASLAMPSLTNSKLMANESGAIAALRSIASSQAVFQWTTAVDADGDGAGEYGYFGELSGNAPLRITGGLLSISNYLDPPTLTGVLGDVSNSTVARAGYAYKMFLPGPGFVGIDEAPNGGATSGSVDTNAAESFWCCYAWPIHAGRSGNRAFFVNQEGDILQTNNKSVLDDSYVYEGSISIPFATAAYSGGGTMDADPGAGEVISNARWTIID